MKNAIIMQQDMTDCGVACLLSIIKYFGGNNTLDNLRRLSGTNISGTTLLGLCQAAKDVGFDAEGFEADISTLLLQPRPVILHVIIANNIQHYVVCFGSSKIKDKIKFIIGDPAKGIVYLTVNG